MDWIALLGLDKRLDEIRRAAGVLSVAAEDRVELLALEWAEERQRLQRLLVLGVLAAALSIVVFTVLSLAVMLQFWDTPWRSWACWGIAGFWSMLWFAVGWRLWCLSAQGHQAFSLTRQELGRDWAEWKERL